MKRRISNEMKIGNVTIGGNHPIAIQSMLNVPSKNIEGNIQQAQELERAGCQIIRVAVPDQQSVALIGVLKESVSMPVVADIHFDWRLAIAAAQAGVDKIRINPGNIGSDEKVKAVAEICNEKGIPIRIGVNSGSIEKEILKKYGHPTPQAMVESALYHTSLLEQYNFHNIAVSMKSNDVPVMMEAYRLLAQQTSYPLHLGVTHSGTAHMGLIKSAVGIGGLLAQGIGDTIRVSLAAPPAKEIEAGQDILKSVGLGSGVEIIACPTCGRASVDIISLTQQVDQALKDETLPITVAVMGCVVNGPGEAREADIGITGGGNGQCALFSKGKVVQTVPQEKVIEALLEQVERIRAERES